MQQRCIKQLHLIGSLYDGLEAGHQFKSLLESNSSLKHKHVKLKKLFIPCFCVTDEESLSMMREFFKNGHASCLEELHLQHCEVSSRGVSILCEVLGNKLCPELTYLDLTTALTMEHCKLKKLNLSHCSLTDKCIPNLRNALQDEHCVLNDFSLRGNKFTEEGKKSLCEIVTNEHFELELIRTDSR